MLKEDKYYPSNLAEAHDMLSQFIIANNLPEIKGSGNRDKTNKGNNSEVLKGAQYLQNSKSELTPDKDGKVHDVKCYNCNKRGHYANECTEPNDGPKDDQKEEVRYVKTLSIVSGADEEDDCDFL